MKYTRILSIAVVAMFAFAAFAVAFNSDSSDADTTDYSSSAYVKLEKISQADFETLYGGTTYSIINSNVEDVVEDFFDTYKIFNHVKATVTYKDITYASSLANTLSGTSYESISAHDIQITDLVIKLKFTSNVDMYYEMYHPSHDSLLEVYKYFGADTINKDSEMTLTFESFSVSDSSDVKEEYSAVPETSNYILTKYISSTSKSLSASVDISRGDKKITIDYDETKANSSETKYDYADSAKYAVGSMYNIGTSKDSDGFNQKVLIKADGKEYVCEDKSSQKYTEELYDSLNKDSNYGAYVNTYSYHPLPTDKYTYHSILSGVSDNNDTAKGQIEAKGGSCNTSIDSAKDLCSDCYGDSKNSFKNEGSNTGLIVALVIVAVIAVILAVVVIIMVSKAKKA